MKFTKDELVLLVSMFEQLVAGGGKYVMMPSLRDDHEEILRKLSVRQREAELLGNWEPVSGWSEQL